MNRPWSAVRTITDDTARSLIETQFPALAPVWIDLLGIGWDNTAYRVNGEWVFRFPRREVAVNLNIGQLMMLLQFGDMDVQTAMYNTEMFAKRVTPQLTDLFEDEWENRWWPKPIAPEARAIPKELAR